MEPGPVVVGIDIAASRPCVAVAVRCGRTLEVESWREADERVAGDRGRLVEWLGSTGAVAVGVDAPQRPRRARAAASPRPRACDADLAHRRISIYQVPTRAAAAEADGLYAWMETGWEYFRELGRRGFEPPAPGALPAALGQAPAALEVYPHAVFATLLGGTPPPKSGRAGLHVRVAVLRAAGIAWDDYYDHDSLDALAAALTAWRFVQGLATPVGDERDGFIWLPVTAHELLPSYGRLNEREALTAARHLACA
jgi:predicted nuclease with RNAse H fold